MHRLFLKLVPPAVLSAGLLFGTGCQSPPEPDTAAGKPFNDQVSGKVLLDEALTRAQAENKRVLLLFGANWCPYCKALHGLLETDPALQEIVAAAYVMVPIDVGSSGRNRNTALIDRYGAPVFKDGVPALVITDARGERLAPNPENPWSLKDSTGSARVREFLEKGRL
jgi:thioredoxin-related protein